jgi:Ca2+-transporting ATPase
MPLFHQLSVEQALNCFSTDPVRGLASAEAIRRHDRFGPNLIPEWKAEGWIVFLIRQFRSPLVYILVIGAAITLFLEEYVDTVVILAAVTVNVGVGFWQEFQSKNILEKLKRIVEVGATVVRDGEPREINAVELVPGDLILLRAGMRVPADARLIEAKSLWANEAVLTGESAPVEKTLAPIDREVPVGDRKNLVHTGTSIEKGEGSAVVVAIGGETELGKIALLTRQAEETPTPLQRRMGDLGIFLSLLIAASTVVIFAVGVYERHSVYEMLLTAIAVAVAAIPEGLPAAISIILAVAAQRILREQGVVKQLVSAETLGSTSVICADKTGTLTEGRMKIKKLLVDGDPKVAERVMALANEAFIERTSAGMTIRGEVTDRAKMQAFFDGGGSLERVLAAEPRLRLIPFDAKRRYLASVHRADPGGAISIYVSGAPEVLLGLASRMDGSGGPEPLDESRRKRLLTAHDDAAAKGYRLIGLAWKRIESVPTPSFDEEDKLAEILCDLTFVGFAALSDPIREDVKASLAAARAAGIKVIMLTGDHRLTAQAIAAELGFAIDREAIMEGAALETTTDQLLMDRISRVEVFARVSPEHKMRIIRSLKAHGHVVAMTGDGVNDAPALKAADIGVALGSGTDVAKEAADLILLNDSFTIIVAAIRQGRIAFDNIRKVALFLLVGSFTELILIFAALALRLPLPLTAVQILWTNLVEDALPNIALAFEPAERMVMNRPPLKREETILDRGSKAVIFGVGVFTDLILVGFYLWLYRYAAIPIEHVRTFVFAAVGLDFLVYIYSLKSLREPIHRSRPLNNPYLVAATTLGLGLMLSAIYLPFLNRVVETVPLSIGDWTMILSLGAVKLAALELAKRRFFPDPAVIPNEPTLSLVPYHDQ